MFKNILLKSQGENRFQYQKQDFGENTFSITFAYNFLDIIWELRKSPMDEGSSIFDLPKDKGYWERRDKPDWEDISDTALSKSRKNPIKYPDERDTFGTSQV